MKKGNGLTEIEIAERNERAKKLYRYVSDIARKIDEETAECKTLKDLFSVKLERYRQKLRDNCDTIIITDPLAFGKKALELLWRKAYYETVSNIKKFHENNDYDDAILMHLYCGIGNFHNIIFKISSAFNFKINMIDFPYMDSEETENLFECDDDLLQWCQHIVHLCLIYLGDLSRYEIEILKHSDFTIASRYYLQSAHLDKSSGMPYNQLGNLYMGINHNLDSVCYYLHCLSCRVPFDGADGNLLHLFEVNGHNLDSLQAENLKTLSQADQVKVFIQRMLLLTEYWYLKKEQNEVAPLCTAALQDLKTCLTFNQLKSDIDCEEQVELTFLDDNNIFRVTAICLFTVSRLNDEPSLVFAAKAFAIALYSQLLQKLLDNLHSMGFKNLYFKNKKVNIIKNDKFDVAIDESIDTNQNECEAENKLESENQLVTENKLESVTAPLTNGFNHDSDAEIKNSSGATDDEHQLTNGDEKKTKKVKRRRRRRIASDEEDYDTETSIDTTKSSENESVVNLSDQSYDSYTSSESSSPCDSEDDVDDNDIKEPHYTESIDSKDNNVDEGYSATLNEKMIQNFLVGNNFIASIQLLQDWLMTETELLKSCGDSGESIFNSLCDILNIFLIYFYGRYCYGDEVKTCTILDYGKSFIKAIGKKYKDVPLPEDIYLRGTNLCKYKLDDKIWDKLDNYKYSLYDENIIRILKFMDFGFNLSKILPKMRFNKYSKVFFVKSGQQRANIKCKAGKEWKEKKKSLRTLVKTTYKHTHGHSQLSQTTKRTNDSNLMHNLGKLWLMSQVRELKHAVMNDGKHHDLPAYLTIDADALCHHIKFVKQLVRLKKFIILIPNVVLQAIDDLKKEHSGARDAIRWLEKELHNGSRFLRVQRPSENKSLPLQKYPKKLSKNTQNFINIIEFCYFIIEEEEGRLSGGGGDGENTSDTKKAKNNILLLLTGTKLPVKDEANDLSITGIAASANVRHEFIGSFMTRWRHLTNINGKKR